MPPALCIGIFLAVRPEAIHPVGKYFLWTISFQAAYLALLYVAWRPQKGCLEIMEMGICYDTWHCVLPRVCESQEMLTQNLAVRVEIELIKKSAAG